MRWAGVLATLLAVAALMSAAARPGSALGPCVPFDIERLVETNQIIAVGTIQQAFPDRGVVAIDRYLKGSGPSEITAHESTDTGTRFFRGIPAMEVLLFFSYVDPSGNVGLPCYGIHPLRVRGVDQGGGLQVLANVQTLLVSGSLPSGGGSPGNDAPRQTALVAAGLALALLGAAMLCVQGKRARM